MKYRKDKLPRQSLGRILRNNIRIVAKVARFAPDYFISVIAEGIIWGLINSAEAVFTVRLFDALDLGKSFGEIASIILFMAVFWVLSYAFDAWYWQYYNPILKRKLELKLHRELFAKSQKIDIACYDDPEFYNDFVWAMNEAGSRAYSVMNDIGKLINRLVACGTLFTLMLGIDGKITAVIFAGAVFTTVIWQIGNRVNYRDEKEYRPLERKRQYIERIFYLQDYAKEIRTSHVTDQMMDAMDRNTEDIFRCGRKYGMKYFLLYGLGDTLVGQLVYFGVLFYMFSRLLDGGVLIGAFAASVNVVWRVRWMMGNFVEIITKFPKHSLFLEKYYGFLAYEPHTVSGEEKIERFESLELRDVSFTYDFSDKPKYEWHEQDYEGPKKECGSADALKHVSLKLSRGEKIAIVGYNGAGKTTLIKLLMRLYDVTQGEILLNGRNIREYDLDNYRGMIGTVFQDFKIFAANVGENVMNGVYDSASDEETVRKALDAAGFTEKLSALEHGLDTGLTREFDDKGTNLSGGESQKVAIARVFARPYQLIIMDEPSSALDPVAEYELNQSILKYAADKTVIFISHRLSTTRMADRIYMFAHGELAEAGSHDELMALGGKYAEMFNLQAEKYRTE